MNLFVGIKLLAFFALCSIDCVVSIVGFNEGIFAFAEPPFPSLLNTSFDVFMVVEIGEFNTSMAELSIVDLAFRNPRNRSQIQMKRRMFNEDRDEIYVTELQLSVPDNITDINPFNSSTLVPDYGKIEIGGRPLLVPAFATGSLKADSNAQSDVLVIGLGGAQLTNYLHNTFPKMNLTIVELESTMVEAARKYFGMKEDKTQRVLVMDGVDFLKKAAEYGWKYDALYIDACPTKYPYEIEVMCPVPVFADESNIALMRDVLKDNGSLVIKMLIFAEDVDESAQKVADKYRKYFANCAILEMVTANNRVLVCSPLGVPKERYEAKVLTENEVKFYTKFGLFDEECCMAAVNECCIYYHPNITITNL